MPETPSQPILEAPLPDRIRLSHDGASLVLEVRGFRRGALRRVAATLFTVAFIVIWFWWGLDFLPSTGAPGFRWFTILAGIYIAYWGLASLVNRARITVGDGAVDVRIGPIPWPGSRRIESREIAQLFGEEVRRSNRGDVSFSYRVCAITPQSQKIVLISGLAGKDMALYVEQQIEKALGITDVKVRGELPK